MVMVITTSDFRNFGCPYCGHKRYHEWASSDKGSRISCTSPVCQNSFVIVDDGETVSPWGFGSEGLPTFYPSVQPHPLASV